MNANYFDAMIRPLTVLPSRRDVLYGLAGAGIGLGLTRLPEDADAKKKSKHKKKPKKAKPNAFGCLNVGDPCKSPEQCCSGICEGKKGKRKCRGHGAGTCKQNQNQCTSLNPVLDVCNGTLDCGCFRTTAGASFCAQGFMANGSECADCQRDADCVALGFSPGSACAPISVGNCLGLCENGTACLVPCGVVP